MQRDGGLARMIVRALRSRALSLREIEGRGEVNFVFAVETPDGSWVVRFARDPLNTDDYSKEAWCLDAARAKGVPTPALIGVGSCAGVPFIVQSFVDGKNAACGRSSELWRRLGRYGRAISEIHLDASAPDSLFPRFGRDPLLNWHEHIAYNLDRLCDSDPLLSLGAYKQEVQAAMRAVFLSLDASIEQFGLTHGDLVPKNAILTPDDRLVVVDWGSACIAPTPHRDYMRILYGDPAEALSGKDLDDFAEGYGTPATGLIPSPAALRLLDAVDVVRWSLDHRPDLVARYVGAAARVVDGFFSQTR